MLLTFNDIIFINAFLRLTRLTITHSFCLSSSLCLPPSLPHNLAAVTARLWERAKTGPFPSASAAAAAREAHHPAVEPGERNTEERTHREKGEREKGRERKSEKRWTEWDRSERAEPAPLSTRSPSSNSRRPS